MKKVCLVFSTGRCGTAFISQLFSGVKWTRESKSKLHLNDDVISCHERGFGIAKTIPKLKSCLFGSDESLDIQTKFVRNMLKEIDSEIPSYHTLILSHMSIGRYTSHCLEKLDNVDYRILHVHRNPNEIAQSYKERLNDGKKIGRSWNIILNNPFEKSAINRLDKSKWDNMNFTNQMLWFCKETEDQWDHLNTMLDPTKLLSIDFKTMFSDESRKSMADFFGVQHYTKHLEKANVRDKSQ